MKNQNFNLRSHLERQKKWSSLTFGPGDRAKGVVDHIRKELCEIEQNPGDLEEWIDVVILALDGAWRSGASPNQIIAQLATKQAKNEARAWPDWRTASPDKAIEHRRGCALCDRGDGTIGHADDCPKHESSIQRWLRKLDELQKEALRKRAAYLASIP